eukprot:8336079-Ditylum_brightwellii.AAC.1
MGSNHCRPAVSAATWGGEAYAYNKCTLVPQLIFSATDDVSRSHHVGVVIAKQQHSVVTPEHLSLTWNIWLETAKKTLQVATQGGVRTAMYTMHMQYSVDHLEGLNRCWLNQQQYMDH